MNPDFYPVPIYAGMMVQFAAPFALTTGTIAAGRYAVTLQGGEAIDLHMIGCAADAIALSKSILRGALADRTARLCADDRVEHARIQMRLRAASPMRPIAAHGRHSADTVGLPLFEPTLL